MEVFRRSIFRTNCDECEKPFPVNTGGVCDNCRRILCDKHLHGSFFRRIAIAFGAPNRCVDCRAGRGPAVA
jgi:hypothetical protein